MDLEELLFIGMQEEPQEVIAAFEKGSGNLRMLIQK